MENPKITIELDLTVLKDLLEDADVPYNESTNVKQYAYGIKHALETIMNEGKIEL